MKIGAKASNALRKARLTRVLILGVNGFIGNHLTERLLQDGGYEVYGLDIGSSAVDRFIGHPNFHFVEGDISIHTEWIEYHIKKCDVILPLVAIATPSSTPATRCACSSSTSRRTSRSSAIA